MRHSPVHELELSRLKKRRFHVRTWIHGALLCAAPTWPIEKRKERDFSCALARLLMLKWGVLCSKGGRFLACKVR